MNRHFSWISMRPISLFLPSYFISKGVHVGGLLIRGGFFSTQFGAAMFYDADDNCWKDDDDGDNDDNKSRNDDTQIWKPNEQRKQGLKLWHKPLVAPRGYS